MGIWTLRAYWGLYGPYWDFVVKDTVDSKKLEYGLRVAYAGCPSYFCFGSRGRAYSNCAASTVGPIRVWALYWPSWDLGV